jgi:hypothetical protein
MSISLLHTSRWVSRTANQLSVNDCFCIPVKSSKAVFRPGDEQRLGGGLMSISFEVLR